MRVLAYAEANGIDLGASRAYGDALADEAMARGRTPSVVSPKRAMRARADGRDGPSSSGRDIESLPLDITTLQSETYTRAI